MLRVPVFQQTHQYVLLSLVIVILVDVKWYFIVVLICTPLMTNDVQNHFKYLLVIFFFGGILLKAFAH